MQVLIAEDSPDDLRLLALLLQEAGYDVVTAATGDQAWALLQRPDAPKLTILDVMLPGIDGLELCRRLRERKHPYTVVLLCTAMCHPDDVIQGFNVGADDYIKKPYDPAELLARLESGRRILVLQDELVAKQDILRERAYRDGLTGLQNRQSIIEMLEHELRRAVRMNQVVSVIMVDVDRFKEINDAGGHGAGDDVLKEVGRRFVASLHGGGVGRVGGEEFLFVLPNCGLAEANRVAERIRIGLAATPIVTRDGPFLVTISLGVATSGPGAQTVELLMSAADRQLYQAKRTGRNRTVSGEFARVTLPDDPLGRKNPR